MNGNIIQSFSHVRHRTLEAASLPQLGGGVKYEVQEDRIHVNFRRYKADVTAGLFDGCLLRHLNIDTG